MRAGVWFYAWQLSLRGSWICLGRFEGSHQPIKAFGSIIPGQQVSHTWRAPGLVAAGTAICGDAARV